MIFLYLIVALVVNLSGLAPRFVEGINACINGNLSGVAIFWLGLLIVFIIEILLAD